VSSRMIGDGEGGDNTERIFGRFRRGRRRSWNSADVENQVNEEFRGDKGEAASHRNAQFQRAAGGGARAWLVRCIAA